MPRYGQMVLGPAGSGKSHYCSTMQNTAQVSRKRTIDVINLDPAAEHFDYQPLADIRDLICLEDVMEDEELSFGPNGGLVFCMEFLLENLNWLEEAIGEAEDDYILFDLPGQIELYTHLPVMRRLTEALQGWNFRLAAVFLLDSHFMIDGGKFISGSTLALTVMANLELPHVNVLSKIDLLDPKAKKRLDVYLEPDTRELTSAACMTSDFSNPRYARLTDALAQVLDTYSLIKYYPLDVSREETADELLLVIDNTIQFGEDADVKTEDHEENDPDDD